MESSKKPKSKTPAKKPKDSVLEQSQSLYSSLYIKFVSFLYLGLILIGILGFQFFTAESPAEFFAENKNIAGFDNVCPFLLFLKFCTDQV